MTNKKQMKVGDVDQKQKRKFMELFECRKKLWHKIQIKQRFEICEEKMIDDILIWNITKIRISL